MMTPRDVAAGAPAGADGLSIGEARELLRREYGWTPAMSTLRRWASRGRLVAWREKRGGYRVTAASLLALIGD